MRAKDHPCLRCGHRATDKHHRLLRSRGGLDDAFNLVPLCHQDHMWVHGNPNAAEAEGLYVRGFMVGGRYFGGDESYREHYNEEMAA